MDSDWLSTGSSLHSTPLLTGSHICTPDSGTHVSKRRHAFGSSIARLTSHVSPLMMNPRIAPFEQHSERYAAWFAHHKAAYQAELDAVRELWPLEADGIEIGVGAAHFAAPLEIKRGVEPAEAMRRRASARGVDAINGVAECLPFPDECCDAALMVTTICFVDDPARSMLEMFRILRPGGCVVVGFIDRESSLGQEYLRKQGENVFYASARFFSVAEVADLLTDAGLAQLQYRQTLFSHPDDMQSPDPVRSGYGAGAFVVVRGVKPHHALDASLADRHAAETERAGGR